MSSTLKRFLPELFKLQNSKSDQSDAVIYQLVAAFDNILFAWTDKGLVALIGVKSNSQNDDILFSSSTVLHLTKIPFGRVLRLEVNSCGTHVALMCKNYCYVVEIPPIIRLFKTASDIESEYLCRCYNVESAEFCSKSSTYLRVRWLPDFANSRHLVCLRSDNIIRIYKIETSNCSLVENISCFKDGVVDSTKISSTLFSLGETAVSFDISPCTELPHISKSPLHTIFVLHGNGDVYNFVVDSFGFRKFPLAGPLTMHPAAEDNYGVDSCDILVLDSSKHSQAITCLVVATSYGNLYHCIAQYESKEDEDDLPSNAQLSLFVYESIELESSLSTLDLNTKNIKASTFSSAVFLYKDSLAADTYHCVHSAGIHSVCVQWLRELEIFNKETCEDDEDLLTNYDKPCIVKYRLCTNINQNDRFSAIKGLVSLFEMPVNHFLLILLPDYSLEIITLSTETLATKIRPAALECGKRPINSSQQSFLDEIKHILLRNTSTPLIKCQIKSVSETEVAEFLLRTVHMLNAEHLNRLKKAHALCLERNRLLCLTCSKQKTESEKIRNRWAGEFESNRRRLADSIDCANNDMNKIRSRIEFLSTFTTGKAKSLSSAELNMTKDLKFMDNQVQLLSEKLNRLNESLAIKAVRYLPEKTSSTNGTGSSDLQRMLDNQNRQIEVLMTDLKLYSS